MNAGPPIPPHPPRRGSLFVLAAVCLAWVSLIWLWEPAYLTLTVDDSFYYLQIARHLAAGDGFTFDGLNQTNGFHPLWLLLLSLIARAAPLEAGPLMRLVLSLQVGLVLGALWLLSRRLWPAAALAASLLLLHFYIAKALINGMESALLLLVMAAALALWARPAGHRTGVASTSRALALGALAGLAVLTRFEAVLFALPLVISPWGPDASPDSSGKRWTARLATAGACALPAAAWGVIAFGRFGHLIPVSAAIKAEQGARIVLGPQRLLGAMSLLALLTLALLVAWRSPARHCGGAPALLLSPLLAFAAGSSLLYLLSGTAVPPIWYLVPHALLLILAAALLLSRIGSRPGRAWMVAILAALWMSWSGSLWAIRLDPDTYAPYLAARRNGLWLRRHSPPDSLAAGWASGITAAHAGRRLINLDGLANSWLYKRRYLDRGRTQAFIDEVWPVEYMAQYLDLARLSSPSPGLFRGVDLSDWRVARSECVHFRSVIRPQRRRRLLYLVLQRQPLEGHSSLAELLQAVPELCAHRNVPRPSDRTSPDGGGR